jgi:hypothetical protein
LRLQKNKTIYNLKDHQLFLKLQINQIKKVIGILIIILEAMAAIITAVVIKILKVKKIYHFHQIKNTNLFIMPASNMLVGNINNTTHYMIRT